MRPALDVAAELSEIDLCPQSRAIVHLWRTGMPADMDALLPSNKRTGLKINIS